MKQKQIIALVSATALAATALAGCGKTSEENPQTTAVKEAEGTAKEDLPFSKYAETVTVHLGGSMNPNAIAITAADAKSKNIQPFDVNGELSFNLHVGADSAADNKIAVKIESMSAAGIGVKDRNTPADRKASAGYPHI